MCFLAAKKHISSPKPAWYALRNSRLSEFLKGKKRRHIPKCWDVTVKKSSFFSFHSFLDSWTSLNYFGCCCCRQVPFPNEHCSRKQSSASFLFLLLLNYILLLSVDALFFLYLAMFDDVTSVWDCNADVFVICKMYKIAGTRSRWKLGITSMYKMLVNFT